MRLFIYQLFFCLLCGGCAVRHSHSVESVQKDVQRLDSLVGALALEQVEVGQSLLETTLNKDVLTNLKLYSPPDSTGKQHLVAEAVITDRSEVETKNKTSDSVRTTGKTVVQRNIVEKDRSVAHQEKEEQSEPVSAKLFRYGVLPAVICSCLLLFIYFIIKRITK